MKKFLLHIVSFVGIYIFALLFAPLYNGDLDSYKNKYYWLEILIVFAVVYAICLYFTELNPRKTVMIIPYLSIKKSILLGFAFSFLIIAWFAIIIVAAIMDNGLLKILIFILWLLYFPILFYFLLYRGVVVYKNKIRIFKIKITTYNTNIIDDISYEELDDSIKVNIIIEGESNYFTISKKDKIRYVARLSKLKK